MNSDDFEVRQLPLADLVDDPNNARTHSQQNVDAVARSLKKFGQQKNIVVIKEGEQYRVVAGHATTAAARQLGWKSISSHVTDLPEAQAAAYGIADNRTAELGQWEVDALKKVVDELADDLTIADIGFTQDQLEAVVPLPEFDPVMPDPVLADDRAETIVVVIADDRLVEDVREAIEETIECSTWGDSVFLRSKK
tara:strand:+ start:498 stop:1082 length:585 start_codon:yes stop_codon:yes gene_type:complete